MQYRRFGETGLVVSRLGFGAMTFGKAESAIKGVWKTDQRAANALVSRALEAGITFFDTADAYADGQSEEMLGRALGTHRRDVVVSTKIGFRVGGEALLHAGLSYRRVIEAVGDSLHRLRTDYLDVLSLHTPDPFTPLDETLRALDDVVRRGWVRYVGYSNYPAWLAAQMVERQRARGYAPMAAAQMYYSLLGRDLEYEHIPFSRSAGIANVIWSPLAGGFLSGRYTREDPTGGGGRIADFDFIPMDRERAYDAIDALRGMADEKRCSVAALALAWLLAKPHVDVILLGASKLHQVEENLGALAVKLTDDDVKRLDALGAKAAPYPQWYLAMIGGDAQTTAALEAQT